MKKIKFIFWLLGFGCGVTVTGIIGTFLSLKIESPKIETSKSDQSMSYDRVIETAPSVLPTEETSANISEAAKEEQMAKDSVKTPEEEPQEAVNAPNESANKTPEPSVVASDEKTMIYKEINIPKLASAKEICDLLAQEGFIEDSEAFLDYIRAQKKQRYLLHGNLNLPVGASMEVLLDELTV